MSDEKKVFTSEDFKYLNPEADGLADHAARLADYRLQELLADVSHPKWMVNLYEEQPDCGGNRHYDYISLEEAKAAKESLETKKFWRDLTSHEIVALRYKAKELHFNQDIVDHVDRLGLIRCLFVTAENRDDWMKEARQLRSALAELKAAREALACLGVTDEHGEHSHLGTFIDHKSCDEVRETIARIDAFINATEGK